MTHFPITSSDTWPDPYLGTVLVELPTLVACYDALPQGSPDGTGDLGIITGDLHVGLVAVCAEQQRSGPVILNHTPHLSPSVVLTDLAWIPQIKEAHKTLIAHLLVCGEHDDVAPEVEATGAHG